MERKESISTTSNAGRSPGVCTRRATQVQFKHGRFSRFFFWQSVCDGDRSGVQGCLSRGGAAAIGRVLGGPRADAGSLPHFVSIAFVRRWVRRGKEWSKGCD